MHIGGARRQGQLILPGNTRIVLLLAVPGNIDGTRRLGVGTGLFGPGTGHDIIRGHARFEKRQRNHAELQGGTALQQQYVKIIGHSQHFTNQGDCFGMHGIVLLAPVAHFDEGHAAVLIIDELVRRFLQYLQRKGRRSCRKVKDSGHCILLYLAIRSVCMKGTIVGNIGAGVNH